MGSLVRGGSGERVTIASLPLCAGGPFSGYEGLGWWPVVVSTNEGASTRICECGTGCLNGDGLAILRLVCWLWGSDPGCHQLWPSSVLCPETGGWERGLESRREGWMFMASSIQEFLGEGYMPRSFTDGVFTEEPLSHWPHGLVKMCQICAGDDDWDLV